VDVQVPEAGNEILACGVDHLRSRRYLDLIGRTNGLHPVSRDHHRLLGDSLSVGHVNHRYSPEGQGRRCLLCRK